MPKAAAATTSASARNIRSPTLPDRSDLSITGCGGRASISLIKPSLGDKHSPRQGAPRPWIRLIAPAFSAARAISTALLMFPAPLRRAHVDRSWSVARAPALAPPQLEDETDHLCHGAVMLLRNGGVELHGSVERPGQRWVLHDRNCLFRRDLADLERGLVNALGKADRGLHAILVLE